MEVNIYIVEIVFVVVHIYLLNKMKSMIFLTKQINFPNCNYRQAFPKPLLNQ